MAFWPPWGHLSGWVQEWAAPPCRITPHRTAANYFTRGNGAYDEQVVTSYSSRKGHSPQPGAQLAKLPAGRGLTMQQRLQSINICLNYPLQKRGSGLLPWVPGPPEARAV